MVVTHTRAKNLGQKIEWLVSVVYKLEWKETDGRT